MIKKKKEKIAHTSKAHRHTSKNDACHETGDSKHHFPSHTAQKRRLNRVKGQLDGIDKMIDDNRYCLDIIFQIRAATSALKSLEKEIMHVHIKSCVKTAMVSTDQFEAQEKIDEIMDFF
jgi:DNA-binding FrmR family transcriptional regulator